MTRDLNLIRADLISAIDRADRSTLEALAVELHNVGSREAHAMEASVRGNLLRLSKDPAGALPFFEHALALYMEDGNRKGEGSVSLNIGSSHRELHSYDEALKWYNATISIAEETRDRNLAAKAMSNVGYVYLQQSNYPDALKSLEAARAIHEDLYDNIGLAHALYGIGNTYSQAADYAAAIENLEHALRLFTDADNQSQVVACLIDIGTVQSEVGNVEHAMQSYDRALQISLEIGYKFHEAAICGDIGLLRMKSADYKGAMQWFDRAIAIVETLNSQAPFYWIWLSVSTALAETQRYDEAVALQQRIQQTDPVNPHDIVDRAIMRANLHMYARELNQAIVAFNEAVVVAQTHGMRQYETDIRKSLRDIAQEQNDFASYIEHNNEYTRITEEIRGKDITLKLAMHEKEKEIRAEREERERERAVLYSTLPKHIANRVIRGETVNDHFDQSSTMFLDIVGFTTLSSDLHPLDLTRMLEGIFKICDEACERHTVTKIKTIGDSYLAAAL